MTVLNYKKLQHLLCVIALISITAACSNSDETRGDANGERLMQQQESTNQAEREVAGTITWGGSDAQLLQQVRCGHRGDEYIMNAMGDNFNLRIYFRDPDGGTAIDFSKRRSFDLRFNENHEYSAVRFYYPNFLESDGHVSASPEGAKGEAELINPINLSGADLIDLLGSTLTYDFSCSHDLNGRRL